MSLMGLNEEDKMNFIDYPLSVEFKIRGQRKLYQPVDDACNISKEEIRDCISEEEKGYNYGNRR